MNRSIQTSLILSTVLASAGHAFSQQQFTRTINVDGLNRQYLIYLPSDFDASENMPVMMWHHGGGGTASEALNFEADFRSLANSERFIAVYPQAYPDVLESCTCWGYEEPGGYENGNYDIDLAYTSAVIDDLAKTYNADRTRIYAGGYSMGASYVWDLACVKSDEIAAIAPVAASCYPWTFEACDCRAADGGLPHPGYRGLLRSLRRWVGSLRSGTARLLGREEPGRSDSGNGFSWRRCDTLHLGSGGRLSCRAAFPT